MLAKANPVSHFLFVRLPLVKNYTIYLSRLDEHCTHLYIFITFFSIFSTYVFFKT